MPEQGDDDGAAELVGPEAAADDDGWFARPGIGWAVLVALALPVAALLAVVARTLTGHSAFLQGVEQDGTYTRIAAAVLGQGGSLSLLPTLVGLAVVALLPRHRHGALPVPVRRGAVALAALVAVVAAAQALLLAYLFTNAPPSQGLFVASGNELEQLSEPAAAAVCTAAVAAVLARLLLTGPEPPTRPEVAPAPEEIAEDEPDEQEPEPDEDPYAGELDPYARFRRPQA